MKKIVYCYYHSVDLDGHCSVAIVRKWAVSEGHGFFGIPVDHNDGNAPFDTLMGRPGVDIGVMVDFCASTPEIMHRLHKHFGRFIWIDHHQSAIDMMDKKCYVNFDGIRRVGDAACELCLEYFFPDEDNNVVSLLGRYDVWDTSDSVHRWDAEIMPFQLAMRLNMGDFLEDDNIPWEAIFDHYPLYTWDDNAREQFIETNQTIGEYLCDYDASLRRAEHKYAFRTNWLGVKCVCVNSSLRGSQTLDAICDIDEMMVVWRFTGDSWSIGLYSHKDSDIDCGAIAAENGGGGHRNAAGFRLPWYQNPVAVMRPED